MRRLVASSSDREVAPLCLLSGGVSVVDPDVDAVHVASEGGFPAGCFVRQGARPSGVLYPVFSRLGPCSAPSVLGMQLRPRVPQVVSYASSHGCDAHADHCCHDQRPRVKGGRHGGLRLSEEAARSCATSEPTAAARACVL